MEADNVVDELLEEVSRNLDVIPADKIKLFAQKFAETMYAWDQSVGGALLYPVAKQLERHLGSMASHIERLEEESDDEKRQHKFVLLSYITMLLGVRYMLCAFALYKTEDNYIDAYHILQTVEAEAQWVSLKLNLMEEENDENQ